MDFLNDLLCSFCKNGIADISDNGPKNLQSNLLGSHVNNFLNSKYKHKLGCGSDPNIKILEKNFKKVGFGMQCVVELTINFKSVQLGQE